MKTEQKNIFIQYHNADNIKEFPSENLDFNTPIQNIQLDDRTKSEVWIYTRKRNVLKAQGCRCFLIVGKTENKIKNYYLWASFIIEDFVSEYENYIDVKGTGNDFKKPILLNNLVLVKIGSIALLLVTILYNINVFKIIFHNVKPIKNE